MEISMLDIFRGFVRNYYGLRLEYYNQEFTDTKYTNVILNYFLRLGEYIGFDGSMEKDRYDLIWKRPGSSEIILHLEHENKVDLDTVLADEFEKLKKSEASVIIGIFYPSSKEDVDIWIKAFQEVEQWEKDVLIIINPLIYEDDKVNVFHALISENQKLKRYMVKMPYLDEPVEIPHQ